MKQARLWDVFKNMAEKTGANFSIDNRAEDIKIDIYLRDVDFNQAIEAVCRISGVKYEFRNNVYYIFGSGD